VSEAARAIVGTCLAKDPARRYPNGAELLRALAAVAASTPPTLTTPPPPPRSRLPVWFAVLMLFTAGAVGVWLARPSVPTHGLTARWEVSGPAPDSSRKAADYIVRRLRERGFPHATVAEVSSASIAVRVPGARAEDEAVLRAIGEAGTFEFREVGNQYEHLSIGTPGGFEEIPRPRETPDRDYLKGTTIRVRRDPVLTGADVTHAAASQAPRGWSVDIELTAEAARRFDALAAKLFADDPKGVIAVFVNGRVVSMPEVRADRFGERLTISGGLERSDAENLSRALKGGGLPCPVTWKGAAAYGE
jgi:preprotein translocase subunit SecD